MHSPITNAPYPDAPHERPEVESHLIHQPETEWTYSHHASITHFNGRFRAIWSSGRIDEDAPGQRVLISDSADFSHWSAPRPLVDALQGDHSELVLTAAGFHQHDGRLVAYFGQYEYIPEKITADGRRTIGDTGHLDPGCRALTSDDGETWSEPIDIHIPIVPNHGPQATASGRLIISGNIMFPFTDDPAGLTGWTPTGIYPPEMQETVMDDSHKFWLVKERMGWPVGLCEGSFFQTDDGVIHMLLRSGTNRLWLTESGDDGASWSPPAPTDFTDNTTKFHFGRLPDGRFYYVGNPTPDNPGERIPLVLSLSDDGVRFTRHVILGETPFKKRQDGMHKHGQYGYPHTLIHDNALHVIVSREKEAIEVLRLPLSAIA